MNRAGIVPAVGLGMIFLSLAGCGGPARLDASSKEGLKASMERMTSGMTDDQEKQFAADCMAVTMQGMMKTMFQGAFGKDKPPAVSETDVFKPLNGMTADEIHAKAEEVRRSLPKP